MNKQQIVRSLLRQIRNATPVDTGNLKASTMSKRIDSNTWIIYVNAGDDPYAKYERGLAPYVPFVNEPWISSFWRGRQNPNQGYWNRAVEKAIRDLAKKTGGDLTKNDTRKTN